MFDWKNLLCTKRVRDLFDGDPSERVIGDNRTTFEQDYGRAVFSTPVRRLQDKAQVFPLEPNDSVRTRLTHSLEVSSIARGLGLRAEAFLNGDMAREVVPPGSISAIAATGGLIHDIGNPPFGHAGEKAISSWFESKPELFKYFPGETIEQKLKSQFAQDFIRFEGNAQTQRLLSSLQILADQFGLNMTCATLSASLKYVVGSNQISKARADSKKHGFFASENELIRKIKDETGTGNSRHPVAFLIEAADDIAYATVDLEDGIKKRCLDWQTLETELRKRADSETLAKILDLTNKKIGPAALTGQQRDEAMSIAFRTFSIIHMTMAAGSTFESNYEAIMNGEYASSLLADSPVFGLVKACKDLALEHVYSSPPTLKLEIMGRKVIWDLLDLYWEAAQYIAQNKAMPVFAQRIHSLISKNYFTVCEGNINNPAKSGIPADYFRMQLITDQVCGMTDSFAVTLHRELTNG
jgi:dGTPase